MDELLDQFVIEGRELVQQASDDLLALEKNTTDIERIDSVFRAVHTLKGAVGLFDLAPMGAMLHAAEDLLGAVRVGQRMVDKPVIDALLRCIGVSEDWIEAIARGDSLPADAAEVSSRIADSLQGTVPVATIERPESEPRGDTAWVAALLAADGVATARTAGRPLLALRYVPSSDCFFLGDDPMALMRAVPELLALRMAPRTTIAAGELDPFACNLVIDAVTAAPLDDVRRIFRFVADQVVLLPIDTAAAPSTPVEEAGSMRQTRTLRVDEQRVDALGAIIGELIVAKNGLGHLAAQATAGGVPLADMLASAHADVERLVADMHRAVMGIRMLPLDRTFRRFPRLVRDIAGQLGKEVGFDVQGGAIEADKAVVDGLFEPLLHVLRNAIDHGIESAHMRLSKGKPPAGQITLTASREGEKIVISVSDDGGGIDPVLIRTIARSRGLLADNRIDALDDSAAIDLIFMPGFSTAAAVTAISGRGVGMDAVRSAVEGLGGRVGVRSEPMAGTTITLTLPQAIAVTTVMIVRVGRDRFGVPIGAVNEICRLPAARVLPVGSGEAFVLRGRTLPLLRLSDLLGIPASAVSQDDVRLLIVPIGDERIGIAVDGFAERVDVVLRRMTGLLSAMRGMRSTALLGDGSVLIVLDLPELIG